jgi:phosphoribosylformylglycinamidine (FGAM) synthase PurS component
VHVGRLVELGVEDESQVGAMCERLLANPLIEDYEIAIDRPDADPRSQNAGPDALRR